MNWLEQRLAETGQTPEQLIQLESQNQAADQVSMSNSIGSLRFLSAVDWREFVETMSVVERVLRSDPADVYNNMDFATRDRYRHVVEEIAKRSSLSEDGVAQRAIQFARDGIAHSDGDDRTTHVGFYLTSKGRSLLEHTVGLRPSATIILRRIGPSLPADALWRSHPRLDSNTDGGSLGDSSWVRPRRMGSPVPGHTVAPMRQSSERVGDELAGNPLLVPPRTLPRMEFSNGIPPDFRTMVIVPTMLTSAAGVRDLLDSLELQFLANRDAHLHFALLTDFCDAPQEAMANDEELVGLAADGIEALNQKYSAERDDAFFLFHRPRRWNEQEGVMDGLGTQARQDRRVQCAITR